MKNEYKVTKELMMSWAKEFHLEGTSNIIKFILLCVMGVIALRALVILILFGGEWINWYLSILLLFLVVYSLFFSRFVFMSKRYKLFSRTYGVTEWLRTTEFAENEIIVSDYNSIAKFKYENIKKIKEKNNVVMIFLNNNLAIRLYKDAFIEGSWEECKEKINSFIK